MQEFEITFLEIDVPKIEQKLLEIGAEKVGDYNFRRALFDYPDFRLMGENKFIRLRTDGTETTLAYKEKPIDTNDGVKEIEVVVESYEKTYELFNAMGFVIKREEENKRTKYKKGETVFDIDSWPFIPTYLEIESTSIENARKVADELGLKGEEGLILDPKEGYKKYGYNLDEYSVITFKEMRKK